MVDAHFFGDARLFGVYVVDVGVAHAHGDVGVSEAAAQQADDVQIVVAQVGVLALEAADDAVVARVDVVTQVAPKTVGQTALLDFVLEALEEFLGSRRVFVTQVDK